MPSHKEYYRYERPLAPPDEIKDASAVHDTAPVPPEVRGRASSSVIYKKEYLDRGDRPLVSPPITDASRQALDKFRTDELVPSATGVLAQSTP